MTDLMIYILVLRFCEFKTLLIRISTLIADKFVD